MKRYFLNLIIAALLGTPTLGFARQDCGGGTIQSFRENAGQQGLFSFKVKFSSQYPQPSTTWYGEFLVHTGSTATTDAVKRLREDIVLAYTSGSFVRFFARDSVNCQDFDEVKVCTNLTNCV